MVIEFSNKQHGDLKLSKNFQVKEFACNDGTDLVLIDTKIVEHLQAIRDYFKLPINIHSGYRTKTYDKKVGGKGTGYHTKGMAVDFSIEGVEPLTIGLYALELFNNTGGIEIGDTYVHIDTAPRRWRAFTKTGGSYYSTVSDFGSYLRRK